MTSKRFYFAMIGLVVLLCLGLVFGAHFAVLQLSDKSDKLVALQVKQQSLDDEQSQLAQAKQEIQKYQPLADTAKSIVPQDKNQAEAVREIVNIASSSGVSLSQISFPQSSLGSATGEASTAKLNLSQLTQVKGLLGVYELPITITADPGQPVSYSQFIDFLGQLENNRRTAQVTNIVLQPDANNPSQLSFILSINEYLKP